MNVLVSLFGFAALAVIQSSTNTVEPKAAEKKVCKTDPEETDSRIRRKICKTVAEWEGNSKKNDRAGARDAAPSDR